MASSSSKPIPLAYSLLSAGPAVEIDDGYALLDVNKLISGGREGCVAFVVTGESMREDILPGYIVFVDTNKEARSGDTVVVSINGEICVKILKHEQQRLYLVPKNGSYPVREVQPSDSFHILGVANGHLAVY
jgi:SOS-response transcriptional repressor LexA